MKKTTYAALLLLIILLFSLVAACGKKGPPTLKSYEKPATPVLARVYRREADIILQWDFPKGREVAINGFNIFRASGLTFERIAVAEPEQRSYTDRTFSEGTKYRYKINAVNLRGIFSVDSKIVEFLPSGVKQPPKDIRYEIGTDSVMIVWKGEGDDVRYNIYKGAEEGKYGLAPLNAAPIKENFFKDKLNLQAAVYYTLRSLSGTDFNEEGPASEEIIVDVSQLTPPKPEDLRGFAAPEGVYLYWKKTDDIWIISYKIYRKMEGRDYELIGETQTPTFLDRGNAVVKRDYRVTAVGPAKEGDAAEIKGIAFIPDRSDPPFFLIEHWTREHEL